MDTNIIVTENAEVKARKSPDLKAKVIEFTLAKEMRLADVVAVGYQRKEVEYLFAAMEADGLGVYEAGRLGRGCSARFICNDGFPEKYTITVQVRRLRTEYVGKPVVVVAPVEASVIMPAQESWLASNETEALVEVAPVVAADAVQPEVTEVIAEP